MEEPFDHVPVDSGLVGEFRLGHSQFLLDHKINNNYEVLHGEGQYRLMGRLLTDAFWLIVLP